MAYTEAHRLGLDRHLLLAVTHHAQFMHVEDSTSVFSHGHYSGASVEDRDLATGCASGLVQGIEVRFRWKATSLLNNSSTCSQLSTFLLRIV